MDGDGRFRLLRAGNIIKAEAPVSDAPLLLDQGDRDIWFVARSTVRLYASPSSRAGTLSRYRYGAEATVLEDVDGTYFRVKMLQDGMVGYIRRSDITYFRRASLSQPAYMRMARAQLFRIDTVETDSAAGVVTATARHVFYDLYGCMVRGPAVIDAWTGGEAVLRQIFYGQLTDAPQHALVTPAAFDRPVRMEAGYKSIVAVLLDEGGVMDQLGGALIRDNFSIYALPALSCDNGLTIRRGKNLLGLVERVDMTGVVTEIEAFAHDENGQLMRFGGGFRSPRYADYPFPLTARRTYDFTVGSADTPTAQDVLRAIEAAVADEYARGADLPHVELQADFLLPDEGDALASLQQVHMFDTVRVIDEVAGVDRKLTVTGYRWDVLKGQYERVTLGQ